MTTIDMVTRVAVKIAHTFQQGDQTLERCGILLGVRIDDHYMVTGFAEVPNTADDPKNDFSMKAGDVKTVCRFVGAGAGDIIGSVHTHQRGSSADPSMSDVEEQPADTLGCVYHLTTSTLTYYNNEEGFISKEVVR